MRPGSADRGVLACSGWSSRCRRWAPSILLLGGRRPGRSTRRATCSATRCRSARSCSAWCCSSTLLGRSGDDRQVGQHLYTWFQAGSLEVGHRPALRPAVGAVPAADHRRRLADPHLLDRLHGARPAPAPVLRLPQPVRRRDADAGARRPTTSALFLGWEGVGLASYLLIGFWQHKPSAAAAAKKAFVVNRVGDIGLSLGIDADLRHLRHHRRSPTISASAGEASDGTLTALGLLLLLGRLRQVGPGAAAVLAARRDGGPDPGLGADPRGDDGDRRRLPGRPLQLHLRLRTATRGPPSSSSATVTLLWGAIIGCAKDDIKKVLAGSTMSQIGYMMLGRRPRPGRLRVRDLPPADARLLQGQHVPRRRLGHARHGRRRRHAPLRRAAQGHAGHVPDLRDGLPRDHRRSPASPASGPRTRSSRPRSTQNWLVGVLAHARRRHHRLLHDPADADDVLHREALGRRTSTRTSRPR